MQKGLSVKGGPQKRADSYFPPEDRVRLVRLVSNWVLPGERSCESSVEYSWNKLRGLQPDLTETIRKRRLSCDLISIRFTDLTLSKQ